MTIIYSTDLASYKLYQPQRVQTDVLILHGNLDQTADNEEITADRQYLRKLRINADDITESVAGLPATILTSDSAKKIVKFIHEAISANHDLVVHCRAGESRTGAVLELAFFTYNLPCVHVQRWYSGRKVTKKEAIVTKDNFYTLYKPNCLWHKLFSQLLLTELTK